MRGAASGSVDKQHLACPPAPVPVSLQNGPFADNAGMVEVAQMEVISSLVLSQRLGWSHHCWGGTKVPTRPSVTW